MVCTRCIRNTLINTQCKRKSSCIAKCGSFCWQHTKSYKGPGIGCSNEWHIGCRFRNRLYRMKYIRVSLRSSAVRFIVQYSEQKNDYVTVVDGTVALSSDPVSRSKYVNIERFHVLPSMRRNGHGTAIIKMLKMLYVNRIVHVECPTAIGKSFYKKMGFKTNKTFKTLELEF